MLSVKPHIHVYTDVHRIQRTDEAFSPAAIEERGLVDELGWIIGG
jgi:hypothetical protein